MSRKIIGVTVGTQLPKPNFKQTDPTKGDYIKNKPDFEGLKSRVDEVDALVGDKKVSEQISEAVATKSDVGHTHDYIAISAKGAAGGVAELDGNGKVLSAQLPSYVDDVVEASSKSAFPATGESGKIYIAIDTNKTYRWSGSAYTEISSSLALGETASTAYRGDRGAAAYTHSQVTSGNPHKVTKSDLGLGNVENKSSSTIRSELTQDNITTALGYTPAKTDVATTSTNGLMSSTDKVALHNLGTLVGDTKVSDQISNAISKIDYPVDSVNGKTGAVQLTAQDVGAMTVGEANSLFSDKADTIQHKTGNIISANNSAHTPVKGLKLYGKTIQNGTPAPDAPIPLESVGADGNVAVTVCGKNLLPMPPGTYENNGVTYQIYEDGRIVANGTAEGISTLDILISLQPGVKYTLSGSPSGGSLDTYYLYMLNTSFKQAVHDYGDGTNFVPEYSNYYVRPRIADGYTANNLTFYPMVRLASVADATYEPYKDGGSVTAHTPNGLPGIPVSSGGNYTDENGQMWVCDEVDFEKGVYVQRVGKILHKGTEPRAVTVMGNYVRTYFVGVANTGGTFSKALSDYLPYLVDYTQESEHFYIASNDDLFCFLKSERLSSVDAVGVQAYFADNPLTVLYVLGTPIETDLTAEEIAQYSALHTNYPNTTIYNDEGAGMELTYYTPSTAVQMVHSPSDEGKMLTIDEHGCVVLGDNTLTNFGITANAQELNYVTGVKENVQTQIDEISATFNNLVGDTSVSEQIETTISNMEDLVFADEEDFATSASPLNADTLGGRPASDFALASELATKAPAGYGLGGNSIPISDCHVTKNGFYMWDEGCANAPFGYAVLLNLSRYGAVGSKLALCSGGLYQGCIAHKVGEEEWEYLNPPMVAGIEYRTTERWNGKAVYKKLVNLGTLPNATVKYVQTEIDGTKYRVIDSSLHICTSSGYTRTCTQDNFDYNFGFETGTIDYSVCVITTVNYSDMSGEVLISYVEK